MIKNPFVSEEFASVWLKHFAKGNKATFFNFIRGLGFIKHQFLPLYSNVGKSQTKGVYYSLSKKNTKDYKGKVFLIYDVPTYFNVKDGPESKRLKQTRIKQYPGFLVELNKYTNLNDYMKSSFGKSSRYKLNKYRKRLELCFNINYKMYYGEISRKQYHEIFEHFKSLLKKRFAKKKVHNNNLEATEWQFYYDVSYQMILDKKASLFVIYNTNEPIGVTLNFFSELVMFDAITVFDIDYAKFHLGSITIMKLIEWGIGQELKIFDFSKGYFPYKERWMTHAYDFEYHLYYDGASLRATTIGYFIIGYYRLKQILRKKRINELYQKVTFRILGKHYKSEKSHLRFTFEVINKITDKTNLKEIDYRKESHGLPKKIIFDFLYANVETETDIKVYSLSHTNRSWLISGKKRDLKVAKVG